jgi:hypothetical protein
LKVGKDYWINSDSIEIIQPWPSRAAERERKNAQETGCYYDATGRKKLLSVLTLKSGWVLGSPLLPDALVSRPTVAAPSRAASRGPKRDELTTVVVASNGSAKANNLASNGHAPVEEN